MMTTSDERKHAVSIARRLLDASEPHMLDVGECELMCRVLLDCADIFRIHAPVLSAANQLVTDNGKCAKEWSAPWNELIKAVQAWRAYEAKQ